MVRYHTLRYVDPPDPVVFHEGDKVTLARGSYQGTCGVFLKLTDDDSRWAEIRESDSSIRSHPMEWLALVPKLP